MKVHRFVAIERTTERIDDSSQQSITHGHVHHPARTQDFISHVEIPVFTEQDDANFVLIHD